MSKNKPFISIIIPLFNKSEYIRQCIDSLVEQSFSDIEVICVDDKSTDDSPDIVNEYTNIDKRIRLLEHKENSGAMKARSTGVNAALGKYIMFLDADDEYELYACEKLHDNVKQYKADIYGFGTNVVCSDNGTKKSAQKFFSTYTGYLYGYEIFSKSFIDQEITWAVWDKMYESQLCKKAFDLIGDDHIKRKANPITADVYAFLTMAYYAESFYGIKDQIYKYHFGRGVMSSGQLSIEQFEEYCISGLDVDSFKKFFTDRNVFEKYSDIIEAFRSRLFKQCTNAWIYQVSQKDKVEALQILMSYWPHSDLLEEFAPKVALWVDKRWETPFKLLPKSGRIVLYGAGVMGKDYHRQISDSGICDIVLWVDKNYLLHQKHGLSVYSTEEITKYNYDLVLIAIQNYSIASEIKEFLIKTYKIPEKSIILNNIVDSEN